MADDQLAVAAAARPVLLHISEGVAWPRGRRWIADQCARAEVLRVPWVSAHLELGHSLLNYHWPLPALIPPALAKRWAIDTITRWIASSTVRILVENMPRALPGGTVTPTRQTRDFFTQVVGETGCYLLLDLAHARVSVAMRGQPVRDYLQGLPLDRVVEIHLSGPRLSQPGGRLVDAHETLQAEDYALLEWVLRRCQPNGPQAVTLEYWRDSSALADQLQRLAEIVDAAPR